MRARRISVALAVALSLGALLLGPLPAGGAPPAQRQRVTLASPSTGLFELPAIVALRQGYYLEENLEASRVRMAPPVTVAALLSGEADYSLAISASVSAILANDAPIRIVAAFADRPLHVLVVSDPAIQSVADLRGGTIGVSAPTDTTAQLARLVARTNGLEPQVDVSLLVLGESPNRLAALQAGQVSAVFLDLSHAVEAERLGARTLLRLADVIELPLGGLVVTETKLREQPAQIEAVIRATLRGVRFMQQQRGDTIAVLMDHLGLSREAAERTYDLGIGSFSTSGLISDRGLQALIDAARETSGDRTRTVSAEQVADLSLARRAAP
jgi:NitT/TauT family transport system substrate-binding protein